MARIKHKEVIYQDDRCFYIIKNGIRLTVDEKYIKNKKIITYNSK